MMKTFIKTILILGCLTAAYLKAETVNESNNQRPVRPYVRVNLPLTSWAIPTMSKDGVEVTAPTYYKALIGFALGADIAKRYAAEFSLGWGIVSYGVQGNGRIYLAEHPRFQPYFIAGAGLYGYTKSCFLCDETNNRSISGPAVGGGFGFRAKLTKRFSLTTQVMVNTMFAEYEHEKEYANPRITNKDVVLVFPIIEIAGLEWKF